MVTRPPAASAAPSPRRSQKGLCNSPWLAATRATLAQVAAAVRAARGRTATVFSADLTRGHAGQRRRQPLKHRSD